MCECTAITGPNEDPDKCRRTAFLLPWLGTFSPCSLSRVVTSTPPHLWLPQAGGSWASRGRFRGDRLRVSLASGGKATESTPVTRFFHGGWHTLFSNGVLQLYPHQIHTKQPSVVSSWHRKTPTTARRSLCPPRHNSPQSPQSTQFAQLPPSPENHGRTTGSLALDDHVQLISPTPYARAEHLPEDLEHEFPNKLTKWRYHAREYLAEFLVRAWIFDDYCGLR